MQGRLARINRAMCSKELIMEERALWDGRARARTPDGRARAHECALCDDGLRGHKDVTLCRAGWLASLVQCVAKS